MIFNVISTPEWKSLFWGEKKQNIVTQQFSTETTQYRQFPVPTLAKHFDGTNEL